MDAQTMRRDSRNFLAVLAVWMISTLRFRPGMKLLTRLGILPKPAEPPASPEKFLIVYLAGHIGDTVMMLPMIELLAEQYPDASIECAVQRGVADFLHEIPQISKVWPFDLDSKPAATVRDALQRSWRITRQYLETMAGKTKPSVCIVPRWGDDTPRSTDLAYLTQATRRIGFDYSQLSDLFPFSEPAMTERTSGGGGMHEPLKPISLLQSAGLLPAFELEPLSQRTTRSLFAIADSIGWVPLATRLGLHPTERFAVIAPGATQIRRIWPVERWIEIGRRLQATGLSLVVLSGRDDAALGRSICESLHGPGDGRCIQVAGATSLAETVALLRRCVLFLGADSGPGHIAGALGVPTIVLMIGVPGANPNHFHAPERVRPSGPLVCAVAIKKTVCPCEDACTAEEQHCILAIETDEVWMAVQEILGVEGRSHRNQSIATVSRG